MAQRAPHPDTIFHIVPSNDAAKALLKHPDNEPYVSSSRPCWTSDRMEIDAQDALEIGYHVSRKPSPGILVEVGRNADLTLTGPSISAIQFSFEIHPQSKAIVLYDRSRLRNTTIKPFGFREDGDIRQLVLQPDTDYVICTGGQGGHLYAFEVWWVNSEKSQAQIQHGYDMAIQRGINPRWARTFDETVSHLPTWYNTRLHTPSQGCVQRVACQELIGKGTYGSVFRAVDLDSGCFIAVKTFKPSKRSDGDADTIPREIKTLASLSHENILEFLGWSGHGEAEASVYMMIKEGNLNHMRERYPADLGTKGVLSQLLHQMLKALDYLDYKGICHRDVKPDNILFTRISKSDWHFQLSDFGLSNKKNLAHTYCGSPLYMAPEVLLDCPQTPKVDVWSLFVTILAIIYPQELEDMNFKRINEIPRAVRALGKRLPELEPMCRKDPSLRASAAQMLVEHFGGNGLTTPRRNVRPIPPLPEPNTTTEQDVQSGLSGRNARLKTLRPRIRRRNRCL